MKIYLAVPTFETIYPDTFKHVWDMNKCGCEIIFDFVRGYDCATARNAIVSQGLDANADYIMMIDNDVTIPEKTLEWFLEDPKDVLLGSYAHRDADNIYRGNTCLCKLEDEFGNPYFNYPLESEYTADEIKEEEKKGNFRFKIHGGGMGCAIIHRSVIEYINYPYYDWVNYSDDNRGMLSEDLYFCEQCRVSNIDIYTDPRIRCGHLLRHIQEV